jgi:hypothetical protein
MRSGVNPTACSLIAQIRRNYIYARFPQCSFINSYLYFCLLRSAANPKASQKQDGKGYKHGDGSNDSHRELIDAYSSNRYQGSLFLAELCISTRSVDRNCTSDLSVSA